MRAANCQGLIPTIVICLSIGWAVGFVCAVLLMVLGSSTEEAVFRYTAVAAFLFSVVSMCATACYRFLDLGIQNRRPIRAYEHFQARVDLIADVLKGNKKSHINVNEYRSLIEATADMARNLEDFAPEGVWYTCDQISFDLMRAVEVLKWNDSPEKSNALWAIGQKIKSCSQFEKSGIRQNAVSESQASKAL